MLDALKLRDAGKNAAEIKEILEKVKLESSIYITVDTLKYLRRRTHYAGGSGDWYSSEFKAGASDSGREARRLR